MARGAWRVACGALRHPPIDLHCAKMKFSAWRLGLSALVVWCVAVACGGEGTGYQAAAVGLGAAVGLTAVNRAVTGDCWAICSPGYACDRQRGTCVRAECIPECAPGEHCVIEQDARFRCMDRLGVARLGSSVRSPAADAGSTPDAAAADAATD